MWLEINRFSTNKKDWKKFESNNKSKHNLKHKNKAIHLMITDGKKCHYLVVKELSALLKGITSNHNRDFYCSDFFYRYST